GQGWQQVMLTYIADSTGQIRIHLHYIAGAGAIYYDDVQLVPLNVASNYSNHYKFTGKERDAETQLDYFGARYYSNGLGGFTSADPSLKSAEVKDPQTWNRYAYVTNNPLKYNDPDGKARNPVTNQEGLSPRPARAVVGRIRQDANPHGGEWGMVRNQGTRPHR